MADNSAHCSPSYSSSAAAASRASGTTFDDGAREMSALQPARWAVIAGVALIGLQLLTLDVVLERHARRAQAQAASYVAVTLAPRPDAVAQAGGAAAPQHLLLAGN